MSQNPLIKFCSGLQCALPFIFVKEEFESDDNNGTEDLLQTNGKRGGSDYEIGLYLKQMGQFELLSTEEERTLATNIADTRDIFRRKIVGLLPVMKAVYSTLQTVHAEGESIERNFFTMSEEDHRFSPTSIAQRLPHALKTGKPLIQKYEASLRYLLESDNEDTTEVEKHATRLRGKIVRLLEEVPVKLEELEAIKRKQEEDLGELALGKKDENLALLYALPTTQLKKELQRVVSAHKTMTAFKNEMAERNLRLVVSIAKKYMKRGMPFQDLIAEGNTGLMRAIEKFDVHRGFKFGTYATWWIKQAIQIALKNKNQVVHTPDNEIQKRTKISRRAEMLAHEGIPVRQIPNLLSKELGIPVSEVQSSAAGSLSLDLAIGENQNDTLAALTVDYREERTVSPELHEKLENVRRCLTYREQQVLDWRFGTHGTEIMTLDEIGRKLGITRERVRQIQTRAIHKLQYPTRKQTLEGLL